MTEIPKSCNCSNSKIICIMKMRKTFVFYIVLSLLLLRTVFGGPLVNSSSEIDIMATLQRSRRNLQDRDYDEYYNDLDLEILEDKNDFLKNTILPPDLPISKNVKNNIQLIDDEPKKAPEYMMDLYKRFANSQLTNPASNIIRSFTNINIADTTVTPKSTLGTTTRLHTMVFNITSISTEEQIDLAELRLYTLVERDRHLFIGVDRKVSVYEVTEDDYGYRLVETKHIYGKDSGWETFDVTYAVRRWVTQSSSIQILEIRIESVFHSVSIGDLDILTKPRDKNEPLLVVYSSEKHKLKLHKKERHELVTREMDMYDVQRPLSEESLQNTTISNKSHNRVKRRARRRHGNCRRRPMYVNFRDINWDTWILAPRGYQAFECVGRCYFPINERLSPSKHAIIQSRLHLTMPKKYPRTSCCVPTKLDPISILYIDEQGTVTYKYKYDGMVVSQCGCR